MELVNNMLKESLFVAYSGILKLSESQRTSQFIRHCSSTSNSPQATHQ
jgi:hypothetical protein